MTQVPRYCPTAPLPPYSYVPGRHPHPVSDPKGHSYRKEPLGADVPDPQRPFSSPAYLWGLDLFNHGYYWEAHEAWESLWKACGGTGTTATFLKGLIKLAASGVKVKEGNADGVRRHAARAAELFSTVGESLEPGGTRFLGLMIADLHDWATNISTDAPRLAASGPRTNLVFPFVLRLESAQE